MRPSPTEPTDADAFQAVCGHTHLFPGARCLLLELPDPDGFAADPRPIDLHLRFRDDVVTAAELRIEEQAGAVLDVPPYTTGAGTPRGSHLADPAPGPSRGRRGADDRQPPLTRPARAARLGPAAAPRGPARRAPLVARAGPWEVADVRDAVPAE
ncbi:hypothetical protein ACW7N6_35335 [Streptomyces sp. UC1A3]